MGVRLGRDGVCTYVCVVYDECGTCVYIYGVYMLWCVYLCVCVCVYVSVCVCV